MRLQHLHLNKLSDYGVVSAIQEMTVSKYLANKASSTPRPINPTIMTMEFNPVYTCGRREIGTIDKKQENYLCADGKASFYQALRGGQTTFHGPGQLVAYPIIDLRRHRITPRDYVCLLEKSVIATCAEFGVKAMTTENTGVWTTPERKISALGLHMRRNITSHGIGLNVNTDLWWFDRIVACGLAGKETTSLQREGVTGKTVQEVGGVFVKKFAEKLGVDGVDVMEDHEDYMEGLDRQIRGNLEAVQPGSSAE
ncbi:lipoyltransferase [Saccharata proteae CBS 121410]|uniref:Octanoyltransferase n=1 Tax=Saccharata proteae CBS 121410 TaxID=1314787 RepID=A0A9P4HZQ6_9PEZI|nr:lipoyltransferase [Saccharata proteae CBS 121410]